jgi:hypothetical protein
MGQSRVAENAAQKHGNQRSEKLVYETSENGVQNTQEHWSALVVLKILANCQKYFVNY